MIKNGEIVSLSVPNHTEVAKGTLRSLLRNAGISIDDYHEALKKQTINLSVFEIL